MLCVVVLSPKLIWVTPTHLVEGEILDPVWMISWCNYLNPALSLDCLIVNGVDSCGTPAWWQDELASAMQKPDKLLAAVSRSSFWSPPLLLQALCSPLQRTEMRLPCSRLRTQPALSNRLPTGWRRPVENP